MIRKPEETRTVFPVKSTPPWLGSASTSFTVLPPATQLADVPSANVNASAPTDATRDAMTHATLKPILNRRDFRRTDNLHQDKSAARTRHAVAPFPGQWRLSMRRKSRRFKM